MEAKRRALDEIATRQRAADEKRNAEAERMEQGARGPPSSSCGAISSYFGKAQFSAGLVDCIAIPTAGIQPNARTSTIKQVW